MNFQIRFNKKIYSSFKTILVLNLIALLTLASPAFAKVIIGEERLMSARNPPLPEGYNTWIGADNNGYTYAAWIHNRYPSEFVRTQTYLNNVPYKETIAHEEQVGAFSIRYPMGCVDSKGNVYLIWHKSSDGYYADLYFKRSVDNGLSWPEKPARLNAVPGSVWLHFGVGTATSIACNDKGRVYVFWARRGGPIDYPLFFIRSEDFGETWSEPIQINSGSAVPDPYLGKPQFAVGNKGYIYAAWMDLRHDRLRIGERVYFNYSSDQGATWQPNDTRIDRAPDNDLNLSRVTMTADHSGNVYIAWVDRTRGIIGVYLNRSHDNGATWQVNDQRISNLNMSTGWIITEGSPTKTIAADDNGYVYGVWHSGAPTFLNFNMSANWGQDWNTEDTVLDEFVPLDAPEICTDSSGRIFVVYTSGPPPYVNDFHVYVNVYNGKYWECEPQGCRLDNPPYTPEFFYPRDYHISCDQSGKAIVSWMDARRGFPFGYDNSYLNTVELQ